MFWFDLDRGHRAARLPQLGAGDEADEARMTEKTKLAKILADNIGLGIANLKLRESMRNLSIRDASWGPS